MVVLSENIAVWNLMPVLDCNVEWLEAANIEQSKCLSHQNLRYWRWR
jgi:hypothetical protein